MEKMDKMTDGFTPTLFLSGINTPVCAMYLITKPHFIIGKSHESDAITDFSSEISRTQACIDLTENGYTITDQNSTNCTFLNGNVLAPGIPYALNDGDIVMFSRFQFRVVKINTTGGTHE